MWQPLPEPKRLKEDSGEYYRDVNSAHYAKHPIEPAMRALLAQKPEIVRHDVDLFVCGSTIGSLLRFVRNVDRPFRFVVELIGDTVFFVRRENSPTEKIPGVRGYGHTFPAEYTRWADSVKGSDSHQRLIRYRFAGFQCIVRYEGDGYLPEHAKSEAGAPVFHCPLLPDLAVKQGGNIIPQKAIFDLNTRWIGKREDILAGEIDRLWARQIPNFILAYHDGGVFEVIRVRNIERELKAWEEEHASDLQELGAVLGKIIAHAREQSQRFEVYCRTTGILEFREVGGDFGTALPEDLCRTWARGKEDSESGGGDSDAYAQSDDEDEAGVNIGSGSGSDDDETEDDFTACSERCGYCERCNSR